MDNRFYLIALYDEYGALFTEKQCHYFEDYYLENLTLSEMSENDQVSRNAVYKQRKEMEEKLLSYEEKLHLYEKRQKLEKIIASIEDPSLKKELSEYL